MSQIDKVDLEIRAVTASEAKRRVRMVLWALAGVAVAFILTIGGGVRLFSTNIQNEIALAAAARNAIFVADILTAADPVADDIDALSSHISGSAGSEFDARWTELRRGVLREFRRVDERGVIVDSSREGEIGARIPEDTILELRMGRRVDTKIDFIRGVELPVGVAMSYAPLLRAGEFTGVIGVWADRTADSRDALRQIENAYIAFALVFLLFCIPTGAILRRYLIQRFSVENELVTRTRELLLGEAVAQFGHWSISSRPMRVSLSTEAERLVGRPHSSANMSLDDFAVLFDPKDRAEITAGFLDLLEGLAASFEIETKAVQTDGKAHDLRLVARRRLDGTEASLFGVVMDITEEREIRRTLKEGEQKFRLLTDNASDVISFYDQNRVLWYVSPSVKRITGYTPEEVMGQDTFDVVHPEDKPKLLERRGITGEAGVADVSTAMWRLLRKDGQYIWMESSVSVIRTASGERQMISIARDVTERVERENALKSAQEQLQTSSEELRVLAQELEFQRERAERANHAKSQFLAVMSHELRTPLTGVIGMAELLQGSQLTVEQSSQVKMLTRSARVLLDQLNEILDLSKIESGNLELESIDFRLSDVLREVQHILAPVALEKSLVLDIPAGAGKYDLVRGDPKRLRQTLLNLVGNAIKFTARGLVTVVPSQRETEVGVEVSFAVTDTGIGIAPDDLKKLFKPFTQAETSTARRFGGTGLGLTISKRFAEAMGGTIQVASQPGQGSTFTLSVKLARAVGGVLTADDAPMKQTKPSRTLRVLLAEDTDTTRYLVAAMLGRQGHLVTAVEDGARAIDTARVGEFDIALIDMHMPVVDGVDAVRAIRAMPSSVAGLPIVALTADVISENVERYLDAGADVVVAKPVDWALLWAEMARLTDADEIPDATKPQVLDEGADRPFNAVMIDEIEELLGKEGMRGLLSKFSTNIETYRDKLLAAHTSGNTKAVAEAAHALRGVAAQFGADHLSILAKRIEESGGDLEQTQELSAKLVDAVGAARREAERRIAA